MNKQNKTNEKVAKERTQAKETSHDNTKMDNRTTSHGSASEILLDNAYSLNYFNDENKRYEPQEQTDGRNIYFKEDYFSCTNNWERKRLELIRSNYQSYDSDSWSDTEARRILPNSRTKSPVATERRRKFVKNNELIKPSKQTYESDSCTDTESSEILQIPRPKFPIASRGCRKFVMSRKLIGSSKQAYESDSCTDTEPHVILPTPRPKCPASRQGRRQFVTSNELNIPSNQSCDSDSCTDKESREIVPIPRPETPIVNQGRRQFVTNQEMIRSSKQSYDSDDTESHQIMPTFRPKSPVASQTRRGRVHPKTQINKFDVPSSSVSPSIDYIAQGARPKIRPTVSPKSTFSMYSRITPSMSGSNYPRDDIEEYSCYGDGFSRPILAPQMSKLEIIYKFMSSHPSHGEFSYY